MSLHNQHFYHGLIRKYVVAFGNIFNSIHIVRYDLNGIETFREKVPLAYGPKQKYLYRTEQNPDLNERFAIKLPRISFEMVEMRYDATRKTPSTNKLKTDVIVNQSKDYQYNAVPYEFLFDVNIMAKNTEDALQMVEQVVPFFTPDYTMTINAIPDLNIKLDIPVIINAITSEDNWDTGFNERRDIVWNLSMTLKGFLYAPTRKSKIILEADWDISGFDNNIMSSGIETTP
jgi:hypothetical protein